MKDIMLGWSKINKDKSKNHLRQQPSSIPSSIEIIEAHLIDDIEYRISHGLNSIER